MGCSGWDYADTPDKGVGREYSILTRKQHGFGIILDSSTLQKWTPIDAHGYIS